MLIDYAAITDKLLECQSQDTQQAEIELLPLLSNANEIVGRWIQVLVKRNLSMDVVEQTPSSTFIGRYSGSCPNCEKLLSVKAGEEYVYCQKCGQRLHFNFEEAKE